MKALCSTLIDYEKTNDGLMKRPCMTVIGYEKT